MPDRNYCYISYGPLDILGKVVNEHAKFSIKRVIFSNPATIVLWTDGSKTIVKSGKNDKYDPEKGLAMCIAKKALGNKGKYYDVFKEWLPEEEKVEEKTEEKAKTVTKKKSVVDLETISAIMDNILDEYETIKEVTASSEDDSAIITCFDACRNVVCISSWNTIMRRLKDLNIP